MPHDSSRKIHARTRNEQKSGAIRDRDRNLTASIPDFGSVARGKGVCHAGQCDFLIAAPVKSFDSGDSNRDLHTLQVARGGQFPLVSVRTQLPEDASASAVIHADLEIQFAGQTAKYQQIAFERVTKGDEIRISGTIPAKLSDFKIDPPSLLALPVKNEIPVRVEMSWRREK